MFFFAFRPNVPLDFCEICGRIGNEVPRKRAILVTKRWVQLDKQRWRRTSLFFEARDSVTNTTDEVDRKAAQVGSLSRAWHVNASRELNVPTRTQVTGCVASLDEVKEESEDSAVVGLDVSPSGACAELDVPTLEIKGWTGYFRPSQLNPAPPS